MVFCHVAVAGQSSLFKWVAVFLLVLVFNLDVLLTHHCFCNFCTLVTED